jgi:hypothetical protein
MKTSWAIWPLHEWQTVLNKLMLQFKRTDGLVTDIGNKLNITVALHIPSSTRTSGITKFVQGLLK